MWEYRAKVADVHDGDTLTLTIDLGFTVTATVTVRLAGAWAPELRQPGGIETRDHLRAIVDALTGEWPLTVVTTRVRSDTHEVTTLGRYVAHVQPINGGPSLTDAVNAFVTAHGYPRGTGAPKVVA